MVILDAYKIFLEEDYTDYAIATKAIMGFHYNKNLLEAIQCSFEEPEKQLEALLGFPWFHARYSELSEQDFLKNYGTPYYDAFVGYYPYMKAEQVEINTDVAKITKRAELTAKNREYLDKIVELYRESDFELVLVNAPYAENADTYQPYYNTLADYCKKEGIPFLNGNLLYGELELNPKRDFGKNNHLCYAGVTKWTRFLENYLLKHYTLEDRRGDPVYQLWEANSLYWDEFFADLEKQKAEEKAALEAAEAEKKEAEEK